MKFEHHIFVCTNERPAGHPRGCCQGKNSEALLKALKTEAAKAGLGKTVRIQKAGCLDSCEKGPVVVVYPEGVWYGHTQASDAPEIVQSHLIEGNPVSRLLLKDEDEA